MKTPLSLICILLIILIFLIIWVVYPLYIASKESKNIMKTVAYEHKVATASMRILVLGDSTAQGVGSKDPKFSTAGRLGMKYPEADITNISSYGLKLAGLAEKMKSLSEGDIYDLIVIQIGANDITHLTSLQNVRRDLRSILSNAEMRGQEVIVLHSGNLGLSPIFHFPINKFISWRTRKVREIYKEEVVSRSNVTYVDLYKERRDDIFLTNVRKYYAADLFHPSDDGYGVWFEEIEKLINKVGI